MHRSERTTIADLTAVGHELGEEHLRLAAGSRKRETYTRDCSMVNGQLVCQLIPD